MHPDFIFFNEVNGRVLPSIVDPHVHHLQDSVVKLRGLADFAEEFEHDFHRVEAVTKVSGKMMALDLTQKTVRDAIRNNEESSPQLYERVGVTY